MKTAAEAAQTIQNRKAPCLPAIRGLSDMDAQEKQPRAVDEEERNSIESIECLQADNVAHQMSEPHTKTKGYETIESHHRE